MLPPVVYSIIIDILFYMFKQWYCFDGFINDLYFILFIFINIAICKIGLQSRCKITKANCYIIDWFNRLRNLIKERYLFNINFEGAARIRIQYLKQ